MEQQQQRVKQLHRRHPLIVAIYLSNQDRWVVDGRFGPISQDDDGNDKNNGDVDTTIRTEKQRHVPIWLHI